MPLLVYCHGKAVEVEIRDGEYFCSCCGRPLPWVAEYFRRRSAAPSAAAAPVAG